MTRASKSLAIWIAAEPTPEPAACTRTPSPARTPQRVTSMCHAVRKVSGNAAASGKSTPSGMGMALVAGRTARSAQPPSTVSPRMP